jgi:hypothetical protein
VVGAVFRSDREAKAEGGAISGMTDAFSEAARPT